ncbi:MAG: protein phosphatase 2C domain-containing protein [Alphaproteobacteria bacterium]|nr:protein phosphatase 2C domain-containing protein [Alphaproteobacteria bacterium]
MLGTKNKTKIVGVSVVGPYHKAKGLKCQDCFAFFQNTSRVVAVVSDGAGSAKYGKIGAKNVCDVLCRVLKRAKFDNIKQDVVDAIEVARDALLIHRFNKQKNEDGLVDFAATLVGAVYFKGRGFFFHIGDGAAIALLGENKDSYVISEPENGIFSSETFFYTMDDWKDSLRFTPFENASSLFLMTDGVTGFALKKSARTFEKGFVLPINHFLEGQTNLKHAKKALKNTLETPKAQNLSMDDKTLVWVRV